MGLNLQETYKGHTATYYWMIFFYESSPTEEKTDVRLKMYFSRDARLEDIENFIAEYRFEIPVKDMTMQNIYDWLKDATNGPTQDENGDNVPGVNGYDGKFVGATDVIE